jgi:hypothetical protein
MILNIDTADKDFVVTQAPRQKVDQNGKPRESKEQPGQLLYTTQLVVTDESGGEIVSVNTSGSPGDLQPGDVVEIAGLIAIPWHSNGRNGVSYRAESIKAVAH